MKNVMILIALALTVVITGASVMQSYRSIAKPHVMWEAENASDFHVAMAEPVEGFQDLTSCEMAMTQAKLAGGGQNFHFCLPEGTEPEV